VNASLLNRRDFVKMAAAAGVAAIMGAEVLPAKVGELETVKPDQGNPIRVDSEWGRLREVIVGIVPDNAIVPTPSISHFKYNSLQTINCHQQCHEKPAKQVLPEAFTAARQQVEALVKIYEKTSIKVHRPRPHTETELHFLRMGGAGGRPKRHRAILEGPVPTEGDLCLPGDAGPAPRPGPPAPICLYATSPAGSFHRG
jgi:hypothetical protein